MDNDHCVLHERTLHMLVGKLNIAQSTLRALVDPQISHSSFGNELRFTPKTMKYALKKGSLDEAIDALETWQRLSDPSWFLILKMNNQRIDEILERGPDIGNPVSSISTIRLGSQSSSRINNNPTKLALPAADLSQMKIEQIIFSDIEMARNVRSDRTITYILDNIESVEVSLEGIRRKNVRELAMRLQHGEPRTFGLLACKGFVAERTITSIFGSPTYCTLVFRIPTGLIAPRSLRDLLLNEKPNSLSQQFSIAQQLAKSVAYVHVFGFVHKNICPENVLWLTEPGNEIPAIFLVGFKDFRTEEGRTLKFGDEDPEKNLYRHPARQGTRPEREFVMQHDIYSLGVCLLEIGLWQSFVHYGDQNDIRKISDEFKAHCHAPAEQLARFLLVSAKDRFVELARSRLRERMGDNYSRIVETCLTCLDPDNVDFGDPREFQDEDGIRVGVRYIEKVRIQENG